ncbi:MAG: SufE family protein [Gemmatimonadota bacterium]
MKPLTDLTIEKVLRNFEFLGDWTERYRYIIDLGKKLPPMDDALKTEESRVRGCQSQVWLVASTDANSGGVSLLADSDAHIVRGLIAMLLVLYAGKTPEEILAIDAKDVFGRLGLDQRLSPSRANGLFSIVGRIREFAQEAA